jgi:hypothetical protein
MLHFAQDAELIATPTGILLSADVAVFLVTHRWFGASWRAASFWCSIENTW